MQFKKYTNQEKLQDVFSKKGKDVITESDCAINVVLKSMHDKKRKK